MSHALLLDHIRDPGSSWSCGRFGAIAEFHRDADEPVEIAAAPAIVATTKRGAIRIEVMPELRPVAYETISKCIESWGQGVVLCLPRELALMSGRTVVTELGPDVGAVQAQDSDAVLFELGSARTVRHLRSLRRSRDDCATARDVRRAAVCRERRSAPASADPQPASCLLLPDGPHRGLSTDTGAGRHVARGPSHSCSSTVAGERPKDHAATVPVPDGWLAGMTLFPAHPLYRASGAVISFDAARHEAFQSLMEQYGDPALLAGKKEAFAASESVFDDAGADARRRAFGFRIGHRQSRGPRPRRITRIWQSLDVAKRHVKDVAIDGPP